MLANALHFFHSRTEEQKEKKKFVKKIGRKNKNFNENVKVYCTN